MDSFAILKPTSFICYQKIIVKFHREKISKFWEKRQGVRLLFFWAKTFCTSELQVWGVKWKVLMSAIRIKSWKKCLTITTWDTSKTINNSSFEFVKFLNFFRTSQKYVEQHILYVKWKLWPVGLRPCTQFENLTDIPGDMSQTKSQKYRDI